MAKKKEQPEAEPTAAVTEPVASNAAEPKAEPVATEPDAVISEPAAAPQGDDALEQQAARIADPIVETAIKLNKTLREPVPYGELPARLVPGPATRCINCGEAGRVTYIDESFHCAACRHTWTVIEEQSPFRKLQRGEL